MGRWVTSRGRHIYIPDEGEEVPDEYKKNVESSFSSTKERQIAANKKEADRLNSRDKNKADETTQRKHKQVIEELNSDKYEDGTYDVATKTTKDFQDGYQVTFCQIGDNYTDNEYAAKVNECLDMSSDRNVYAGKFEGTPEISFHCKDRKQAEAYARANNQISIWDWKAYQKAVAYDKAHPNPTTEAEKDKSAHLWLMCSIDTGGTGERGNKK